MTMHHIYSKKSMQYISFVLEGDILYIQTWSWTEQWFINGSTFTRAAIISLYVRVSFWNFGLKLCNTALRHYMYTYRCQQAITDFLNNAWQTDTCHPSTLWKGSLAVWLLFMSLNVDRTSWGIKVLYMCKTHLDNATKIWIHKDVSLDKLRLWPAGGTTGVMRGSLINEIHLLVK